MRLALQLGYDDPLGGIALAQEADRLGFHSVWTSEAYGTDAVTPMAWIAATTERIKVGSGIMQMPARSPAATATTVATLDLLSGGRVLLGLGTSGPQVAEGWHGQAWGKPLTRTREYVEIVRTILRREEPLEHHGEHYDIPYSGPGATGLGKPLKIIVHPVRERGADLPGGDRPEERRARRRDRRRLAARSSSPRSGRRASTGRCWRRGSRAAAAAPTTSTSRRSCRC